MKRSPLFKVLLFLGVLPAIYCRAQPSFQYKSVLQKVTSPGFYKIILPPAVVGRCTDELMDIRILDETGKQVPYILQSSQDEAGKSTFTELPILSKKRDSDKQTHVIIQNQINKAIHEILLVIKNNEAERSVDISGSDDKKNWFIIKENVRLANFYPPDNEDRFIQSVDFPPSSYKFFNIVINGKDLLPINIVKAGVYQDLFRHNKYLEVPSPIVKQKDSSNQTSYIHVQFNDTYLVNKLELSVQGAKFFRRELRIHEPVMNAATQVQSYSISSAAPASFSLNIKARALVLEIENGDNPPLKIGAVKAYQVNKSLLAYLDPAIKYELLFGDPFAKAPNYDLRFFRDSITSNAADIGMGPVAKIDLAKKIDKPANKNNPLLLWIVIAAVLALLLTLTLQMTKEMKKKESGQ